MRLTQNDEKHICEFSVQKSRNNNQNAKYWIVETMRQKWKYYEEQKQTHPNKQIRNANPHRKKEGLIEIWARICFSFFFHTVIILLYSFYILFFVWNFIHFTCVFLLCVLSFILVSFNFIFGYATFLPLLFHRIPILLYKSDWVGRFFDIPSPYLLSHLFTHSVSICLCVSCFTRFLVIKMLAIFLLFEKYSPCRWMARQFFFFWLAHNVYHDSQANSFHFPSSIQKFHFFPLRIPNFPRSSIFG